MAGVVNTTYTFTATDLVTSSKLNNIIDQTVFTSDAIDGSTLTLTAAYKLKVSTGGITANELAANSVVTVGILDLNVTTGKLADLSVTTGKLADLSVTAGKLGASAVTAVKIFAGNGTFPIKVQQVVKSDTQSITGGSWVDVASLSLAFTRVNVTSKMRVQAMIGVSSNNVNYDVVLRIDRAGTTVGIPATAGSRSLGTASVNHYGGYTPVAVVVDFIDDVSALGTNPLTYKIQAYIESGVTGYINRAQVDTDSVTVARTISTLTLTELA